MTRLNKHQTLIAHRRARGPPRLGEPATESLPRAASQGDGSAVVLSLSMSDLRQAVGLGNVWPHQPLVATSFRRPAFRTDASYFRGVTSSMSSFFSLSNGNRTI